MQKGSFFSVIDLFVPDPTILLIANKGVQAIPLGIHRGFGIMDDYKCLSYQEQNRCNGQLSLCLHRKHARALLHCSERGCPCEMHFRANKVNELPWTIMKALFAANLVELRARGRHWRTRDFFYTPTDDVSATLHSFCSETVSGDDSFEPLVKNNTEGQYHRWRDGIVNEKRCIISMPLLPNSSIAIANIQSADGGPYHDALVNIALMEALLLRKMEMDFQEKIGTMANLAKQASSSFHWK